MFYKLIEIDETTKYIQILKTPNQEILFSLNKLRKSSDYNFSESSKVLYLFENLKHSENIDDIFESLGVPLLNIANKCNHRFTTLSSGEYKGIPLYCLPKSYLQYITSKTYDNQIKEEINNILKKRFL